MSGFTEQGTSKTVKAGELDIHYNEAGEGDAVIMLHGGGPGASGWSNFKQNVEAFAAHFRVLIVDQPGFGKSSKPMHKEAIGAFNARAIRDLMDALKIDKAHFVGNSMGGLVSVKFALDYPDRAAKLVLMGAAGTGPVALNPQPTEGIKTVAQFYRPPGPSKDKMRAVIRALTHDSFQFDDTTVEERFAAATEPETAGWQSKMMFNPNGAPMEELWRDIHNVSHPTLAIWGREDRVSPFERGLFMLHRMPDLRLHIIAHCGHWAMVEHPEMFNRLSIDFLRAV